MTFSKTLKIGKSKTSKGILPQITIRDTEKRLLEKAGFHVGDTVALTIDKGFLSIRIMEDIQKVDNFQDCITEAKYTKSAGDIKSFVGPAGSEFIPAELLEKVSPFLQKEEGCAIKDLESCQSTLETLKKNPNKNREQFRLLALKAYMLARKFLSKTLKEQADCISCEAYQQSVPKPGGKISGRNKKSHN